MPNVATRTKKRTTKTARRTKTALKHSALAERLAHRAWLVESELEDRTEQLLATFRAMTVEQQAACFDRVLDSPNLVKALLGGPAC